MGRIFAYARVSTDRQDLDPQVDELRVDGFDILVIEKAPGADRFRPELAKFVREIKVGDILKVVRIDRLARSVSHLLDVVETLEQKSAHFRSLRDPIYTTTSQGMFTLQILGAVAQLERALIADRTKAGIRSARERGRVGGNPSIRAGDPVAIAKIVKARAETYDRRLVKGMEEFMPIVRNMWPSCSWLEVATALASSTGTTWTVKRVRQTVRRLVAKGLVDQAVLARSKRPPKQRTHELALLVQGLAIANPNMSIRAIGEQLQAMKMRIPTGNIAWSPTSVSHLLTKRLERAEGT